MGVFFSKFAVLLNLPLPIDPMQFLVPLLLSGTDIGLIAIGFVVEDALLLLYLLLLPFHFLQDVGSPVLGARVGKLELPILGLDVVHFGLELVELALEGTHLALELEHLFIGSWEPLLFTHTHPHILIAIFLLNAVQVDYHLPPSTCNAPLAPQHLPKSPLSRYVQSPLPLGGKTAFFTLKIPPINPGP